MYGERDVTKEEILNKVSEEDIFKLFTDIPFSELTNSPLRVDKNPSFILGNWRGSIRFKDFGTGEFGDCFKFVMLKYKVNFYEALKIIATATKVKKYEKYREMNFITDNNVNYEVAESKITDIRVKRRDWNKFDIKFWNSFGWTKKLVDEYYISPLQAFWINGYMIVPKKDNPAYCYYFGNYKYKIYQPFNKEYKFINNSGEIIQGYKQLPKKNGILIITKSMKDIGTLRNCDYWAIAPQSENTMIDEKMMLDLHKRFLELIVLFDNDESGINSSKLLCKKYEKYQLKNLILPCKEKDISDYCKNHGIINTMNFIDELILWNV